MRSNRRAAGAPLTGILRGETMPGTEDGPAAAFAWRGAMCCVMAGHHRPGDANTKDGFLPPPARYDAALLCDAIGLAARAVRLDAPRIRPAHPAGFGRELDRRPAWDLGPRTSIGDLRLRHWAHTLGYGGHPRLPSHLARGRHAVAMIVRELEPVSGIEPLTCRYKKHAPEP